MQNVGLVYASLVKPDDIGLFNSLNLLSSKQMELLAAESSLDIDGTSIQIFGKGRDDNSDGDFMGGSFLGVVTVDSSSIHSGEIGEIFNSFIPSDNSNLVISEPNPEQFFICVRPGAVLNPNDKTTIASIVKRSSSSYEISELIDQMLCDIDESDAMEAKGAPVSQNNNSVVSGQNVETAESLDQIAEKVYQLIKEDLFKEGSEFNTLLNEIRNNKSELEANIVQSVMFRVNENINKISNVSMEEPVGEPVGIESIETVISNVTKNITNEHVSVENSTSIYDNQVQLKDLLQGCENDEMLFARVMENKAKLSQDDLLNVAQFDMYEYLHNNDNVTLSPRDQLMRKIKLGLN